MKPKKVNRILSQFEYYLKGQNSFGIGLNENQRNNFIKYAKRVLDKEKKKVSPNLEALKEAINPAFTQPKEVGEKSISNGIDIIKITPFFIVDGKASGFIYYKNNNTCDIHINKCICNARIPVDNNFIIRRVLITNDSIIKLIGYSFKLSSKAWKQEGNTLVIF